MEIILKNTKFQVPKVAPLHKAPKDQETAAIAKFLPPLKPKPQVRFGLRLMLTYSDLPRVLFEPRKTFVINAIDR